MMGVDEKVREAMEIMRRIDARQSPLSKTVDQLNHRLDSEHAYENWYGGLGIMLTGPWVAGTALEVSMQLGQWVASLPGGLPTINFLQNVGRGFIGEPVVKPIIALGTAGALAEVEAGKVGAGGGDAFLQQAELVAQTLVIEGQSNARVAVTAQVVRDAAGDVSILGVVTGNTKGYPGPLERGWDIAVRLENRAEELGFTADFYAGRRGTNYHAEGIHDFLLRLLELTPLSAPYINRGPCGIGWQCAAAQQAIGAIILEISPGGSH
jgi:hypothetical protein